MSQENVEIVRRGYELWGLDPTGGAAGINLVHLRELFDGDLRASAAKVFDPEIEWIEPEGSPVSTGVRRGYDGVLSIWRDVLATFDEYLIEPIDFREAAGQVVVIQRNVGRAREMEVDETFSLLFTLRDRRIARIQVFASRDGALKAAGPAA